MSRGDMRSGKKNIYEGFAWPCFLSFMVGTLLRPGIGLLHRIGELHGTAILLFFSLLLFLLLALSASYFGFPLLVFLSAPLGAFAGQLSRTIWGIVWQHETFKIHLALLYAGLIPALFLLLVRGAGMSYSVYKTLKRARPVEIVPQWDDLFVLGLILALILSIFH